MGNGCEGSKYVENITQSITHVMREEEIEVLWEFRNGKNTANQEKNGRPPKGIFLTHGPW